MKKLFIIIILFIACRLSVAQVVIQPGALVKTTNNVQIIFNNINVINNDISSDFSSSIITCKGANNALLNGTGKWVIKKLIVDKKAAKLSLGAAIQINKQLQLLSGTLDLNGQTLTLSSGATLEGENETARIIGPGGGMIQTTVSLNIPSSQNPGKLGAVISSNKNLGSVTIKRWHNLISGESKVRRFYEITPVNNTALNATLRFYYLDAELNNIPEASLDIFTRSNAQVPWTVLGNTGKNASLNYIEKTGVSSLQQYSLGSNNVMLSLTLGTESASDFKKNFRTQLSPVPATSATNLTVYSEETYKSNFKLYSVEGKLYQQKALSIEPGANQFVIDVSRLTSGMYYVMIDLPDGRQQRLSLVKQ